MRRRPTDPASRGLRLFVLVTIFGVALPSLLLTGFGLIAIGNERAAATQRLSEMYQPLCRTLAAKASREIQARAEALRDRLTLLERWARREIPPPAPWPAEAFAGGLLGVTIFDDDGRWLLPRRERPDPTWHGFLPPEYEEGLQREFSLGDPAAAAASYRAALAPHTPGPGRCPILSALARSLWKAGDVSAAAATLEEAGLRCVDFVDHTGYHVGLGNLLFALEIAPTMEARRRAAEALALRLSDPLLLAAPGQVRITLRRALDALGQDAPGSPSEARARLLRLSSREALGAAIAGRAPAGRAGFEAPLVEGQLRLLWLDQKGRVAVEWLPEAFEREVLLPALAAENTGARLLVRLAHVAQKRADGDPEPAASAPLEGDLGDLRVELRLADAGALDELARSRTRLYLWALLLLVLVLAGGIGWLVIITVREARLTRLKTDFVSSVSHELRTPLTSIRMFVDTLLLGRTRDEAERREALSIIAAESERLTRLTERILDFSRMEAGRRAYRFEPQQVGELVRAALDACRPLIEERGFSVESDIPAGLPPVPADRDAIIEVLVNLLSNAVKYSPDNRRVEVSARAEAGQLLMMVRDFGIGIPASEHKRIFEKFYRIDHPVTVAAGGSGLGLSLVRYIVSAHGGEVAVDSAPGKGSTFTVRLPLQRGLA
ncbi:MAG: hypothetical protein GYA21_03820 [Myxococcales bacterium]|nr:hypothetical protein [Myxococcales bacterium]